MTVATARAALVAALGTSVSRIYSSIPDTVEVPAIVVGNPDIEFDDTMMGTAVYRFPMYVLASRAADSLRAVANLDTLIETVHTALNTDGNAQPLRVTGYDAHGYAWGGTEYAGCTFEVEVYG